MLVPENTRKPALIKLLISELELETVWADEERREERAVERAE